MIEEIIERLSNIKLFSFIKTDVERLERLAKLFNIIQCKKGEIVLKEGDLGDSLHIIFSGSVRIVKHTSARDPYTVVILEDHENVFFGEISLLEDSRRTATVVCESDCTFLVLGREQFGEICRTDHYVGMMVMRRLAEILAERLRKADDDIITLFNALVEEIGEV